MRSVILGIAWIFLTPRYNAIITDISVGTERSRKCIAERNKQQSRYHDIRCVSLSHHVASCKIKTEWFRKYGPQSSTANSTHHRRACVCGVWSLPSSSAFYRPYGRPCRLYGSPNRWGLFWILEDTTHKNGWVHPHPRCAFLTCFVGCLGTWEGGKLISIPPQNTIEELKRCDKHLTMVNPMA